jgi:hypothetical protein
MPRRRPGPRLAQIVSWCHWPAQLTSGVHPRGYKRPSVRITLTVFLSRFPARAAYLPFPHRCCTASAPVVSTGCWSWRHHAVSCSPPHAWIWLCFFLCIPMRASTRAPMRESAPASQRRPGPFCASPAPDVMVAWSFCLIFFFFVPVRDKR